MNGSTKSILGFVDSLTSAFRSFATVGKIAFGPKQLFSNTAQVVLEQGIKGGKAFDVRSFIDAGFLFMDIYRNKTTKLPDFFSDVFSKYLNAGAKGADSILAERLAL